MDLIIEGLDSVRAFVVNMIQQEKLTYTWRPMAGKRWRIYVPRGRFLYRSLGVISGITSLHW